MFFIECMLKVECELFPEMRSEGLFLRSVKIGESLVASYVDKSMTVFKRNTAGPTKYIDDFSFLFCAFFNFFTFAFMFFSHFYVMFLRLTRLFFLFKLFGTFFFIYEIFVLLHFFRLFSVLLVTIIYIACFCDYFPPVHHFVCRIILVFMNIILYIFL